MPLDNEQYKKWLQDMERQLNEAIKDMDDTSREKFLKAVSNSFLGMQLGAKNENHK